MKSTRPHFTKYLRTDDNKIDLKRSNKHAGCRLKVGSVLVWDLNLGPPIQTWACPGDVKYVSGKHCCVLGDSLGVRWPEWHMLTTSASDKKVSLHLGLQRSAPAVVYCRSHDNFLAGDDRGKYLNPVLMCHLMRLLCCTLPHLLNINRNVRYLLGRYLFIKWSTELVSLLTW